MTIYFSAKTNSFFDTQVHGERYIRVPDPDWVRPVYETTIKPGDFAHTADGLVRNETESEIVVDVIEMLAEHPFIEVLNPNCKLPPESELVEISVEEHQRIFDGQSSGLIISADEDGYPVLIEPPKPPLADLIEQLKTSIDRCADAAYTAIAGQRTAEYQMTEADAQSFKDAGYKGDVPLSVQSYVDSSNLTPKQATDNILAQAAAMRALVAQIREARLVGKSKVKSAVNAGAAQSAADEARNAINQLWSKT